MSSFSDIVGQEQLKEHLQKAIETGKISHAYIINGESGCGKKHIATLFAMAIQCEDKEKAPCRECRSCKQSLSGNHPDIIYVTHEKPNSIGVEDIRTQLNNDIGIKPYSSQFKVYIIDEGEKMTPQAQNAILKTIEEPPSYAVILILTTNVEAMLPTIMSRCVVLNVRPVSDQLVRKYLMEQYQIPDYKAEVCTAFARGNIGRAKSLASSDDFEHMKSDVVSLLQDVDQMDISEIVASIKKITDEKYNIDSYLDFIAVWYRDILLYKATNDMNHLIFKEEIQYIRKVADRSSYQDIEEVITSIDKAKSRLKANVNFDLTMELMLLTMKVN